DEPHRLARRLVGAVEVNLKHVKADRHHHRARPPMVQPPDKVAERHLLLNKLHAVVGVVGGRGIVKNQKGSGGCLHQKEKEGDASENIDPAGAPRDRFVEKMMEDRGKVETVENPGENPIHQISSFLEIPALNS